MANGLLVKKQYTPDFVNDNYSRAYMNLTASLGLSEDRSNGITLANFKAGTALYAFNLTGDLNEPEGAAHLIRRGELTLNLNFTEELANTTSVFVYQERDGELRIDPEGRIIPSEGLFG